MFSIHRSPTKKARHLILAGSAIAILGATSCTTQSPPAASTVEEPVTAQANPTPPPAAPPAAPPASTEADPEVQAATVIDGLEHPWGMVWLPNGDMLITERPGRLRLVQAGALAPEPVAGLPSDILTENQGGLLDIALHPEFEANRLVYFTYSHGTLSANRTRVARATFDGTALSDWQMIFEVDQTKPRGQHFGSRLAWLPDGTLLVSIGDGGNPPIELEGELIRQQAQNTGSHLGKVVRLNDDGSVPSDNPFVGDASAAPEVWSYGHRNIQGLAIDSATGQVWATEHGSRGGDEVNQITGGENYGWPAATHSREYSGGLISPEQSLPGMVDPVVIWTPSIAPSGLAVYRGDRLPGWQGDLFAGGLVSQDIRRIEVDESGRLVSEVSIPIGQRVRAVRQGPDGLLYVLTDEANGQILRLEPVSG